MMIENNEKSLQCGMIGGEELHLYQKYKCGIFMEVDNG